MIIDIKSPVFKIFADKNINSLEQKAARLYKEEGWYPVGGVGRKGNDWIQVIMKEDPNG
jgi:hypothetical protein